MAKEIKVAIAGSGGFAAVHAYALSVLHYYYPDMPVPAPWLVCSTSKGRREAFAERFGFQNAIDPSALWEREDIDAFLIVGPNETHAAYLVEAVRHGVQRVYVEKPICVSTAEERDLSMLAHGSKAYIQVGFQFLQMPAIRRAMMLWRDGRFGEPVHFSARYLHGGYLDKSYREKRAWRLKPSPAGGALADLGSHCLSMLVAFLGKRIEMVQALSSGSFEDVDPGSDLCTTLLLKEIGSGAVGTMTASRISAGSGDQLELEIRCREGGFRFSTETPNQLQYCEEKDHGIWKTLDCGGDYGPNRGFPSAHVPAGWMRSLVHAHFLFLGGVDPDTFCPDLEHGLVVQRLILKAAALIKR